jgi:hypothetical protein
MHFEIKSAFGKQLTPRQRKSGFVEVPHVAGKVLRRGVVAKLSPEQCEVNHLALYKLLKSESIEIWAVDGERREQILNLPTVGEVHAMKAKYETAKEELVESPAPSESPAAEPTAPEAPVTAQAPAAEPTASAETAPEAVTQVEVPVTEVSPAAEEDHKSKKKTKNR